MSSDRHPAGPGRSLAATIREEIGVALDHYYQCGKCAAGCPVAEDMELTSSQLLRLLQYEFPDLDRKTLQSESIWLCLGCATCYTRCPQAIAIPQVMDFLRAEAVSQGLAHPKSKTIRAFHQAFLHSIAAHGRLYEFGLVGNYKRRTGHWLQDMVLAPKLFSKGKLGLLPHGIQDKAAVKRLFKRATGGKE